MLNYLERLNVPTLGDTLSVSINRTNYLPEVSTRTLMSFPQGLKTLVNVAHALAHHTVAIDRGLSLPGLLVLDGVSANSGERDSTAIASSTCTGCSRKSPTTATGCNSSLSTTRFPNPSLRMPRAKVGSP